MGKLFIKGSSGLSFPAYRCRCGKVNIHNWSDLRRNWKETGKYTRLVDRECSSCGLIYSKTIRLTAGNRSFKFTRYDWVWWGFVLYKWLPFSWWKRLYPWIMCLEMRYPL